MEGSLTFCKMMNLILYLTANTRTYILLCNIETGRTYA